MVNRYEILKKLENAPIFGVQEVSNITEKEKEYAKVILQRMKTNGLILQIERDKYTLQKDPLIIASRIIWPSYISGWAAIRYYNLTTQLPTEINIITTRTRKKGHIVFNNTKVTFTRVKKEHFFGFEKRIYNNFEIFIAKKEKAIIDSIVFGLISTEEAIEIVRANKLDLAILKKYGQKFQSKRYSNMIKQFFGGLYDK